MNNGESKDGLEFNLDALTDGKNDAPSLSDVYQLPIFSKEVSELSDKLNEDSVQTKIRLENLIFDTEGEVNTEIENIRNSVFSAQILSKETAVTIQPTSVSGTYIAGGIVFFSILLIIGFFYGMKKKKEREKTIEATNYFDSI